MDRLLHIYSQPFQHGDARIAGNRAGLEWLQQVITDALHKGRHRTVDGMTFAADGEGYDVEVLVMPADCYEHKGGKHTREPTWAKYSPHYCDRGYQDDTHKGE